MKKRQKRGWKPVFSPFLRALGTRVAVIQPKSIPSRVHRRVPDQELAPEGLSKGNRVPHVFFNEGRYKTFRCGDFLSFPHRFPGRRPLQ